MSAEDPRVVPDRVVFARMPGFELVRYAGRGWRLWSAVSGKEAKVSPDEAWQLAVTRDAEVIYDLEGGSRFYAQVHKSNSASHDYRHHTTAWALLSPGAAWKLMPDEPPEILMGYRVASAAAREAHLELVARRREAETAWFAAIAKIAELPQFQGKALNVPANGWPCIESPLRVCIYDDNAEDGYRLSCLVCGGPHERD